MLYKRAFRKEKEVITFLMILLKWTSAINGEAPSLMRGLNAHRSAIGNASLAPCPWSNSNIEEFTRIDFGYRASATCKDAKATPLTFAFVTRSVTIFGPVTCRAFV